MLVGDVGYATRRGTHELPDRIVVAERPNPNDLAKPDLVAGHRDLEVALTVNPERFANGLREGDLALGGDLGYLHTEILTMRITPPQQG